MFQNNNNKTENDDRLNVELENKSIISCCFKLPKPKLERQTAFNIKDLPTSKLWPHIESNTNTKLWTDIVFNSESNTYFDTESNNKSKIWSDIVFNPESDDDDNEEWNFIDLLNRILCNCKLISYKKVRPLSL